MRTSRTNSQFQSLILTVLLLAILVVSINMVAFTQATTASSAPPSSVNVQVNDNNVQVQMHLVLTVNATILPLFHVMIDTAKNNTSESNNVTQPILTAIQKLVPNAKLDKFTLSASVVNMSNTYTLTEDYSFTVIGV